MRNFVLIGILLTSIVGSIVQAKEAAVSMAYTNAFADDLPFSIFSKKGWAPDPNARFVKLHLYFDQPIMVKGLEIDTCGSKKIDPNLSVFFNFDQWILRLEPSLAGEMPEALYPEKRGNLLIVEGFEEKIEVRSLTLNFEFNSGFKICGINLKDPEGVIYDIKTPALVPGKVEASSTLEPRSAYDPIYLFDSRFEHGWASDKKQKDVTLSFSFNVAKRIEKVRIWNGYQRSVNHCFSNSRAKRIRITGDGDYKAEISVKDILGSQEIKLPKAFVGKNLKFDIVDSFPGKAYRDLVISEIRFHDGKDWFMLDPSAKLKESILHHRNEFSKAKVSPLLNDSYTARQEQKKEPQFITSKLRLRADGSFYMSGYLGEAEDTQYFALGNYEVKEANEKDGLKLRIFGLYYESEAYGDCNGCGRDCNKNSSAEGDGEQKIFQEHISIKAKQNGKFEVLNESGGKKIKFKKLEFTRETEEK